jgi:hypothetical protein
MSGYLKKALEVVERLEREKGKELSPERKMTLESVMDAIILSYRDEIVKLHKQGKWKPSPETKKVEGEIEAVQGDIMQGMGKLIDFDRACKKWRDSGTK